MKKSSLLLFLFACYVSGKAFTAAQGKPLGLFNGWKWVKSINYGPTWHQSGKTQSFFLAPDIEKTYTAEKSNQISMFGAFFLGAQKQLSAQWQGQLGVSLGAYSHAALSGEILEDADPQFNNYVYTYNV